MDNDEKDGASEVISIFSILLGSSFVYLSHLNFKSLLSFCSYFLTQLAPYEEVDLALQKVPDVPTVEKAVERTKVLVDVSTYLTYLIAYANVTDLFVGIVQISHSLFSGYSFGVSSLPFIFFIWSIS